MTFGDTVDAATAGAMVDDRARRRHHRHRHRQRLRRRRAAKRMLAELLPGRRDQVVLATKAGMPHPDHGDARAAVRGGAARRASTGSLRRLGTDHIDLFYLHQPDRSTPLARNPGAPCRALLDRARSARWASPTSRPGRSPNCTAWPPRSAPRDPVVAQQLYNLVAAPHGGGVRRIRRHHRAAHHGLQPARRRPAHRQAQLRHQAPDNGRFGDSRLGRDVQRAVLERARCSRPSPTLQPHRRRRGPTLAELSLRWLPSTGPASTPCCSAAPRSRTSAGQHRRRRQGPAARRTSLAAVRRGRRRPARPDARLQPLTIPRTRRPATSSQGVSQSGILGHTCPPGGRWLACVR